LQEMYYGGWVAPNIYYLGAAGVVNYKGLRIAGVSGIYKHFDYQKGRYEFPPYDRSSLRSVYHVRNIEVARLKCLSNKNVSAVTQNENAPEEQIADVMISHDWPRGIEQHGNVNNLLRKKQYFRQEVETNSLGSPANEELLMTLKPKWWFAAHLHVKFEANYRHRSTSNATLAEGAELRGASSMQNNNAKLLPSQIISSAIKTSKKNEEIVNSPVDEEEYIPLPESSSKNQHTTTSFIGLESSSNRCVNPDGDLSDLMTKFLSLDKCLPRKHYLQIVNMPSKKKNTDDENSNDCNLYYDLEWLAVLRKTHGWTSPNNAKIQDPDISAIQISEEDLKNVQNRLSDYYKLHRDDDDINNHDDVTQIPTNFTMTLQPHGAIGSDVKVNGGRMIGNPQTDTLLEILGLNHIITTPYIFVGGDERTSQITDTQVRDAIHNNASGHYGPSAAKISRFAEGSNHEVTDSNEIELDSSDDEAKEQGNRDEQKDNNEIELDSSDDDNTELDKIDEKNKVESKCSEGTQNMDLDSN